MYESSVIQHFVEQGIKKDFEQGKRKAALEVLIDILEFRFSPDEVLPLKLVLENIEELQQLKQLHQQALEVPNLDEFKQILSSNGN